MPEFSLSPCLFIGIGTNGWRIMDDLRQLIYEEFGVGGLPCFRYIGIETNSGKLPDNSFLPPNPRNYETITPVYITIPDISVIRKRIDPKLHQEYKAGLHEWLDVRLIDRGGKSYQAGAGNARHAGRLCLWENWPQVKQAITRAYEEISSIETRMQADKFLREEYFAKKKSGASLPTENLISSAPKVYIFGTLCGGTCSGTFIDIAYFVSKLLGVSRTQVMRRPAEPEVVGMFTIVDSIRASEPKLRVNVANCWAAMRELDFYFQKESVYSARFPDGTDFHTRDEPFDTVYLVGMRNLAGAGFVGEPEQGLTQMCAMNLFTEVVAGMAARKDENRVNLRATSPGYLKPNQNGHIRGFSSFGLSAIWYPRYRIARAINRHLGGRMFDAWLGSDVNTGNVGDDAHQNWTNLLARARGSLLGTVDGAHCNVNLPAEVAAAFERREAEFQAVDEFGLDEFTVNFPTGNSTFTQRLANPGGEYYQRVDAARSLVLRDLKVELEASVTHYLREHSFAETKAYLEFFIKQAAADEQAIPGELPSFSQKMDFSLAHDVHNDLWTKLLFMREAAIVEYKQAVWGDFKRRVVSQLERVRDHFLQSILREAQPALLELATRLARAEVRLRTVRDNCETEKQQQINFQHASNIVPISEGKPETIRDDVADGAAEILKTMDPLSLRRTLLNQENPLFLIENRQPHSLVAMTDQSFDALSQKIITRFHIGKEALAHLQNRIRDLVESSAAYIETVSSFKQITTVQWPNFLFCHDLEAARSLVERADANLANSRYTNAPSPLDHFVFFYQEVPGLAISDLAIADFAFRLLEEMEKSPDRIATNFTHQMGEKMFNLRAIQDFETATHWVSAMRYLAPDLFKTVGGELCLDYETRQGLKRELAVEKDAAVREYLEDYGAEVLIKRFCEKLQAVGRPVVLQRMDEKAGQTRTLDERKTVQDAHEGFLKSAFFISAVPGAQTPTRNPAT